jgi:inward rectifier potassium channel
VKRSDASRSYTLRVLGEQRRPLADAYHFLLRTSWLTVISSFVTLYLALNAVFATLFWWTHGLANSDGSWTTCFFFSVQTFGTIGYGSQYPISGSAHLWVTSESVVSLLFSALTTGLLFAKFSRPQGRIVFADKAAIAVFREMPTLMLRIGNERGNRVVEANVHVDISRTEKLADGATFYRQDELALSRSRISALSRTWNLIHVIDAKSPLFGKTPEDLVAEEVELMISVTGLDDTSGQTIHGHALYEADEIIFGARPADVLSETSDGLQLDVRKFDELAAVQPTAAFPYEYVPTKKSV